MGDAEQWATELLAENTSCAYLVHPVYPLPKSMSKKSAARQENPKPNRVSAVPPMPLALGCHSLFDEITGEQGTLFWRVLQDGQTWLECSDRKDLFWPERPDCWRALYPEELSQQLGACEALTQNPEDVEPARLAEAYAGISNWAETRELIETALGFAEVAARLEPERSDRSDNAGRLSRRRGKSQRASMWYLRAARLARKQEDERAFSSAHLGLSNLELDLGNLKAAEKHGGKAYRAALRLGRRRDAARAFHTLANVYIHQDRYDEAWAHMRNAVASYPVDDPRLPALAHDAAYLLARKGYNSSAMLIIERVLPTITRSDERLIVIANLARSSAAARDRVRYERASREVLGVLDSGGAVPPPALYHLAYAARNYDDWDRAARLVDLVADRAPGAYKALVTELAEAVTKHLPGDEDIIPEEGGEVEEIRERLLKKLKKHVASLPVATASEKYPIPRWTGTEPP